MLLHLSKFNVWIILIQIVLRFERFDDALNLLDQASSEGIELDVTIMNTIMKEACVKVPPMALCHTCSNFLKTFQKQHGVNSEIHY